jgi:hypothetical protein
MSRGTLIGNSEEKKKRASGCTQAAHHHPFLQVNHGRCDRDTKPCGRRVRKTRRYGTNRRDGGAFCIANNVHRRRRQNGFDSNGSIQ